MTPNELRVLITEVVAHANEDLQKVVDSLRTDQTLMVEQ